MDLYKFHSRRKIGFVTSQTYSQVMSYEIYKKLYSSCQFDMIPTTYSSQAVDYSLYSHKLLIAHTDLQVALYDALKPVELGQNFIKVWSVKNTFRPGLESINWNCSGDFFTYTANGKHLYSVDAEQMREVERMEIKGTKSILQHRPNPHNSAMIAVASQSSKVIVVDLRSGNLTCTSSYHPKGVLSVSWSGLNENLLVTAGDNGTCFWDVRRFRRPIFINKDNCIISAVLPNFEIIPNTDKLIMLNVDRDLTVWDVHKMEKVSHYGPFIMPFEKCLRYKFALAGHSEPGLIFMPADQDIRVYDFHSMKRIGVLHGHFMPVQVLFFNDYRGQLFSSSLDGSMVWVPNHPCS